MSQAVAKYPISLLLNRLIHEFSLSRAKFAVSLLHGNPERGVRSLESWIRTGEGPQRIMARIASTYPWVATELNLALRETTAFRKTEQKCRWNDRCEAEKEAFIPFIHCVGERTIPEPITSFGVTGGHTRWTTITLPQYVLDLPLDEQLRAVLPLMREYAARFNGQVPFFGKLRRFLFVRLLDYFVLDVDGVLVGQVLEPFRPGIVETWLT